MSIKWKIILKKVVTSVMIKSTKMQLRIKIKLLWIIVMKLMVPHTSTKVVKMTSEEKKIIQCQHDKTCLRMGDVNRPQA